MPEETELEWESSVHQTAVIERNVRIGRGTEIGPLVYVKAGTWIGERCYIGSFVRTGGEGNRIGRFCVIKTHAVLSPGVVIGEGATIGPHAVLLHLKHDGTHVPCKIGPAVFVGARAVIMPGVNVGARAVIGAGAVVTRDVPEDAIVAGIPARVIG